MNPPGFFTLSPTKGDQARLRLLGAGLAVFGEKGLQGATVRQIAHRAGQNVAAIAYYFGSKEKLYFAVLEGIIGEMRRRLEAELGEIERFRQSARPNPEEAQRLLRRMLGAIYLGLLSRNDAAALTRLVVREQMQPTKGFDILYERGFRQLHETLCWLVGLALGKNPRDRETIVRTHTLMGQVYFFVMSREAILRRLGWRDLEGKNAELVTRILEENIQALLSGLSHRPELAHATLPDHL